MNTQLNINHLPNDMVFPLISCYIFSYFIFYFIVRSFLPDNIHFDWTQDLRLTAEETFVLLDSLGVSELLHTNTFFGLIAAYLNYLNNLNVILYLDFHTLEPGVLMGLLNSLKPLMLCHELAFSVLNNYTTLNVYDLNDLERGLELWRESGNTLYEVYRAIERTLDVNTGVPVQ
jgi:hypothetical protein